MADRPALSVVITVRDGLAEIDFVLEGLLPQALRTGTEVVVVGAVDEQAPEGVRLVRVDDPNIFTLRLAGIRAARGEVIAIGEDHAVPRADWCEMVIRAHAERPGVPAIIGCLVNATNTTRSGRGNFLAFAAPVEAPLRGMPQRPPPLSALSFKREVLEGLDDRLGHFEAELVPELFAAGRMAADPRIVVDHHQDHGALWSIVNGFHGSRSAYGYLRANQSPAQRLQQARWSIVNWPRRILREARDAATGTRGDLTLVALVGTAVGLGGAVGALTGPGRSPDRVA